MSTVHLPEKEQTQDEFIKEELSKGKPPLTIEQWVDMISKVEEQHEMILERTKNWPIYNTLKAKIQEYLKEKENVSKEKDQVKTDSTPAGQTEKSSDPIKKLEEEDSLIETAEPIADIKQSDIVKDLKSKPPRGSSGEFRRNGITLLTTNKAICGLKYTVTPRNKKVYFYYDRGVEIGNFTDEKSFRLAFEKLITDFRGTYKMLLNLDTEISVDVGDRGKERTAEAVRGFNPLKLAYQVFNPNQYASQIDFGVNGEIVADSVKNDMRVCLLPEEVILYKEMEKQVMRDFYDVEELISFCRTYLTDDTTTYFTLSPQQKRLMGYKRIPFRLHPADYFKEMAMTVPVVQDYVNRMVGSIIDQHIISSSFTTTKILTNYLEGGQIRINEYNTANSVATDVLKHSPTKFLNGLIAVLLTGRFRKIKYVIPDYITFSYTRLLDCLVLKLFMPRFIMDDESVAQIDNYILVHILMNQYKWKHKDLDVHSRAVRSQNVNVLKNFLSQRGDEREIRDFLLSDEDGHGWASGGKRLYYFNTTHLDYFNSKARFEFPYGTSFSEPDETFTQLDRFFAFSQRIMRDGFFKRSFNGQYKFINYLRLVLGRMENFRELALNLTKTLERLTVSCLTFPAFTVLRDVAKIPGQLDRSDVLITVGQPHSFAAMMEPQGYDIKAMPFSYVENGLNARSWAYELCERNRYIKEKYNDKKFTKNEKMDFVFDASRQYTSSMDGAIKTYYLSTGSKGFRLPKFKHDMRMKEDREPFEKILKDRPSLYGYVERLYFMRTPHIISKGEFSQIYCYDPKIGSKVVTLTYQKIFDLLSKHEFNKFLLDNYKADVVIEFKIRAKFDLIKVGIDPEFQPQKLPFEINYGVSETEVPYAGKFSVYYQIKDEIERVMGRQEVRMPSLPHIMMHVDDFPFLCDAKVGDYMDITTSMEVHNKNLEFVEYSSFINKMLVPLI